MKEAPVAPPRNPSGKRPGNTLASQGIRWSLREQAGASGNRRGAQSQEQSLLDKQLRFNGKSSAAGRRQRRPGATSTL